MLRLSHVLAIIGWAVCAVHPCGAQVVSLSLGDGATPSPSPLDPVIVSQDTRQFQLKIDARGKKRLIRLDPTREAEISWADASGASGWRDCVSVCTADIRLKSGISSAGLELHYVAAAPDGMENWKSKDPASWDKIAAALPFNVAVGTPRQTAEANTAPPPIDAPPPSGPNYLAYGLIALVAAVAISAIVFLIRTVTASRVAPPPSNPVFSSPAPSSHPYPEPQPEPQYQAGPRYDRDPQAAPVSPAELASIKAAIESLTQSVQSSATRLDRHDATLQTVGKIMAELNRLSDLIATLAILPDRIARLESESDKDRKALREGAVNLLAVAEKLTAPAEAQVSDLEKRAQSFF